ncbi:ribosomal RNA small subunit methyltransferase NEP1-like [Prunus yedoensis var. nudiflora]|uniref:Ribosomal RNA small subunit methyltransferase NEP1-like n=1 Tax=Prunus yedoensis var. nudiflora TaxID=2094558 RepID=A0A314YZ97_PRUYE|nr:ribosomal RNA small subunit methyltransferase NEP1-like [Prunus yedoensis var. nudiflora]
MKRQTLGPCSTRNSKSRFGGIKQGEDERNDEDSMYHLPGIPLTPSNQNMNRGVTFVLEKASLVPAFVGRTYQILNPQVHADFLRRKKLDPYKYRPDIVHEALRQIMDTRLCKAGRLDAVYIKTDEGVLIKVEPQATIPESLEKFCYMMSQLLQKLSIKSTGRRGRLLRVVKNPIAQHLPANSLKIGKPPIMRRVGAMAHGRIDSENADDIISVSDYPLSAVVCLERISIALERKWNIL